MYYVSAFYKFFKLSPEAIQNSIALLNDFAANDRCCGLIIIAPEGINATLATKSAEDRQILEQLIDQILMGNIPVFKHSETEAKPFKRFKIKERPEIVTLNRPDLFPDGDCGHLSPKDWHAELASMDDSKVLIDTRNWYETDIGIFEGAVDPRIDMFTEFADYLKERQIPKDKKILMYCTGGIRCEKASLLMKDMGYEHVYQLDGGILKYMEEFPEGKFKGECFVFDHRVSVAQGLEASKNFGLCPLCGNPGEQRVDCCYCGENGIICHACADKFPKHVCSKNCRHHVYERNTQQSPSVLTERQ